MLRLSRDRLLVSLAPATVSWVRVSGGLRPRVAAKRTLNVASEDTREPWEGAVAVLREEAQQLRAERLAVTVVLSNHFVRYTVVPPVDNASSRDEALALARFHFSRIHGHRAVGWDVRLASGSGRATVASAVDSALLDALKACFPAKSAARLASVQPYTMSAFNFWRHKIEKDGAWLLLVEPGTACIAMLSGKDWSSIQNVKSSSSAENWPALLDREKHRVASTSVPKLVLTRSTLPTPSALTARKDWRFVTLEAPALPGLAENEREAYAMALHAA